MTQMTRQQQASMRPRVFPAEDDAQREKAEEILELQ